MDPLARRWEKTWWDGRDLLGLLLFPLELVGVAAVEVVPPVLLGLTGAEISSR